MRRIIVNTSLVTILVIFTLINSGNVVALSCAVPSLYPDVASAVLNGCNIIVFDGDVTEATSFTVPFPIVIDGNGFKWTLVNPAVDKIIFDSDGLVELYNINITVVDQYTTVFLVRNSSLNIDNVNVTILSTYVYLFRSDPVNTYNISFTILNFLVDEYSGSGFRRIFSIDSASSYSVSVYAYNVKINGIISPLFAIPAAFFVSSPDGGEFMLSEAKLNNASVLIYAKPGSTSKYNVEISNTFIEAGGVPPYILGWYASYIQFFLGSEMDINLSNVTVISNGGYDAIIYLLAYLNGGNSSMYGENIYVENPLRGGIFVSHGGFFNSYIYLRRVTFNSLYALYGDSWRAIEVSNSTIVVDTFSFYSYSPLNTFFINEDVTLKVNLMNGILYEGVFLVQDFWQMDSTVYIEISNVTIYTNRFGAIQLISFFPETKYFVDIEGLYSYPKSSLTSYWSIYIFQSSASDVITLDVRYSVLGGFIISSFSGFDGSIYETVYSEAISYTTKPIEVFWTLEIYVESMRSGRAIPGIDVSYYENWNILETVYTGHAGIALYGYNYIYQPFIFGFKYIDRIRFSINETYYSNAWWYNKSDSMVEFKDVSLVPPFYTLSSYTLPRWFGRIVISLDTVLEIYGIGFIEHRPMTISLLGDSGYIGLYKQIEDVIYPYLNISRQQPPLMIIPIRVLEVIDYDVYLVIETKILYKGLLFEETFIYYKTLGILYSTGPLEIVARVIKF